MAKQDNKEKLFQTALKKLDPKNLEAGLPGREEQNSQLHNFIYHRLKIRKTGAAKRARVEAGEVADIKGIHDNKTMFVCGVPGTGKTVSVLRVLDSLEQQMNKRPADIHPFKRAYINGQHLQSPAKLYCEMLRQFAGKNCSTDVAQELLDAMFVPEERREKSKLYYIAVIDELDVLYSERKNSLFYSLFDWPTSTDSRLILIVIANAMDLSERFLRGRIQSRLGWEKLLFESYNTDALVNIVQTRLGKDLMSQCFEDNAVKLAAMRISRSTGDARRILDMCRLSIARAIKDKIPKVNAALINIISTENLDTLKVKFVEKCPLMQLYTLKAILAQIKMVSEENVIASGVYEQLSNLLKKDPYFSKIGYVPSHLDFENTLNDLAAASIILLEHSKPLVLKHVFIKDNSHEFKELIKNTPNHRDMDIFP